MFTSFSLLRETFSKCSFTPRCKDNLERDVTNFVSKHDFGKPKGMGESFGKPRGYALESQHD